ncbi:MAG: hypothetical protein P8164_06915 [Gammaproteobacteria bacterium]|jgi:hypothetical protein
MAENCQRVYRELFPYHIDLEELHAICGALNHELVLERSYFKDRIEVLTQVSVINVPLGAIDLEAEVAVQLSWVADIPALGCL